MLLPALFLVLGIGGFVACFVYVNCALHARKFRRAWMAIVVLVLYLAGLFALAEYDDRFVEQAIKDNHGVIPDWVF